MNRQQSEREKKWKERGDQFWRVFLFTKDGRPKSGFMIYTFSLSIAFLALYMVAFLGVLELLAPWLSEKTGILVNLIPSVIVLLIGLLVSVLLHHLLKDKRLMLGTYGWLALYLAAGAVTMAVYLHDAEAYGLFLGAFFWFALLPVIPALICHWFLCRRDYRPQIQAEPEPDWKKYIRRQ